MGVEPKIGVFPPQNHPFVHRVFHEINHPFWGYHYVWKHPYIASNFLPLICFRLFFFTSVEKASKETGGETAYGAALRELGGRILDSTFFGEAGIRSRCFSNICFFFAQNFPEIHIE